MALDRYKGIINGDCDIVLQNMVDDGIKYDLILTDPPYNVGKDFGNTSDKLPLDVFLKSMYHRIDMLKQLLSDTGSIIWFGIHDYICYIQVYMYQVGLFYRRMNIWHYENGFPEVQECLLLTMNHFCGFQKIPRNGLIIQTKCVFRIKVRNGSNLLLNIKTRMGTKKYGNHQKKVL